MALKQTWDEAGEGMVIGGDAGKRRYRVEGSGGYYEEFVEETYTETVRWDALTQAAADDAIGRNVQPEDPESTYTWRKAIENKATRAYSVERTLTRTNTYMAASGDLPAPTMDPEGEVADGRRQQPHQVTITTDVDNVKLYYRIRIWSGGPSGFWVDAGGWQNTTNKTVTVTVSSTNTYSDPYYRLVRIEALVQKVISETETKSSGTTVQDYRDTLEVSVPEFDPNEKSGTGGLPFTVEISWNDEDAHGEFRILAPSGTGEWIGTGGAATSPWVNGFTTQDKNPFRLEARLRKTVGGVTYYGRSVFSNYYST